MKRPSVALVCASSCLALAACGSTSEKNEIASLDVVSVPMDVEGSLDSPWEYLRARYDRNGDGQVVATEYDRDQFGRLDRNGDGVLNAHDFAPREVDPSGMGGMGDMMALMMLAKYFQDDANVEELTIEELEIAVGAYDADFDGGITKKEFAEASPRRAQDPKNARMYEQFAGEIDPWEALLSAIDQNANARLEGLELIAYFEERDDGDLVWKLDGYGGTGMEERSAPRSGVPEGEPAPDFTLTPPADGESVTLSSFRGKKPVALVFGSYT